MIGTNWITGALIDAGRTVEGFEVGAVLSRDAGRGRAFADRYAIGRVHTALTDLADDDTIDAVYIASPNSLHAEQAIALLGAGKHVLVEKPLAADVSQLRAVRDAASTAGRLAMEAYMAPFQPNVAAIRDGLPAVGPIRRVVLVKDQYSSRYDQLRAGELPNAFNPAFAAGSLMDLGIYPVALAIHLFGEPLSMVATGVLLPSGVDGQGTVLLGYDGFEVACLHSKITPAGIGSEISGEQGVLTFDDCSVPTTVHLAPRVGAAQELARGQSVHHMRHEVAHFLECVGSGLVESPIWPTGPGGSASVLSLLGQARAQVGVRFPSDPPA